MLKKLHFTVLFLIFAISLKAQIAPEMISSKTDAYNLKGAHTIELNLGFLSNYSSSTEITFNGVTTKNTSSGFTGALTYIYWFNKDAGITASIGGTPVNTDVTAGTTGTYVETATVVSILAGIKYQPFLLGMKNEVRPYLYFAVGPYIGIASNVHAGLNTGVESYTETALGTRIAAGLDASVSNLITLGFSAGYRAITDFKTRIGPEVNHSTPDFTLNFGVNIR